MKNIKVNVRASIVRINDTNTKDTSVDIIIIVQGTNTIVVTSIVIVTNVVKKASAVIKTAMTKANVADVTGVVNVPNVKKITQKTVIVQNFSVTQRSYVFMQYINTKEYCPEYIPKKIIATNPITKLIPITNRNT